MNRKFWREMDKEFLAGMAISILLISILGLLTWFVFSDTTTKENAKAYNLGYNQGFLDGKIAGVFEDIQHAEKYISENCVCEKEIEKIEKNALVKNCIAQGQKEFLCRDYYNYKGEKNDG